MKFLSRYAAIASPATLLIFWHSAALAIPSIPSEETVPLRVASALPTLERTLNTSDHDKFAQQTQLTSPTPSANPRASESQLTPLQLPPIRLFNLETANQLPQGAFYTTAGARIFPKGSSAGSGLQVFHGLFEAGVTQRLQIGGHFLLFDDFLGKPIQGLSTNLEVLGIAPQFKYQVLKLEKLKLGVSGSVEYLKFTTDNKSTASGLFKPVNSPSVVTTHTLAGTLQVPVTFDLTPQFQWHVTPGVAFFPDSVNKGSDFYGTFAHIGTGFSWQALKRVSFFADVNVPFGPGKNAVNSNASLYRQVVWSGGGRFLVSPAVGVDLYATNAFGQTPATRILSFIPGGGQTAFGINLVYTPDIIQDYPTSFRPRKIPYRDRDHQLMLDGITLTSADTLSKGAILFDIGTNTGSATDFKIAYGISDDAQIEFLGQSFSDGSSVTYSDSIGRPRDQGNSLKLGAGVKVRFLDQAKGDPFSLSFKGEFSDSTDREDGTGIIRADASLQYQVTPRVALTFNPQFAAFGPVRLYGAGLGLNAEVYRGLQLMGEFTPSFKGNKSVWSGGLRYQHAKTGLGFDVYASNSVGRNFSGGLSAESDDTNFGVNLHWLGRRK